MGETFSTLRRLQTAVEQKFVPLNRADTDQHRQDEASSSMTENIGNTKKGTAGPTQVKDETVAESDDIERESGTWDASKRTIKHEPTENSSDVKPTIETQYNIAEMMDEAPFPPSPPMPRDSDEIKLEETSASPVSKPRTIYVSGDDREPDLEFNEIELEVDHFARVPSSDTSVMSVGEPVIRHPFPPTDEEVKDDESITVVVNVESRHHGKRRRSMHSFTSHGGEPSAEIVKYVDNDEMFDAEECETPIGPDANVQEEDLVEVKVDFYRRKRRRNCSAPCNYPALHDSLLRADR